ncbi:hypothetical protein HEAFMP_HEAFMP_14005, partial [Dysosmobacter welbionis]
HQTAPGGAPLPGGPGRDRLHRRRTGGGPASGGLPGGPGHHLPPAGKAGGRRGGPQGQHRG